MGFWDEINRVLAGAAHAKTADELIAVVRTGPHQEPDAGDAVFAGSGGDNQLIEAVRASGHWTIIRNEYNYWWKAVSKVDSSVIEYIEGGVYRRPA